MSRAVPLAFLALLQIADYLSTRAFLAVGVTEGNTIVRYLGIGQAKLVGLVVVCLLAWRARQIWMLWALCGFYSIVVAVNVLAVAK